MSVVQPAYPRGPFFYFIQLYKHTPHILQPLPLANTPFNLLPGRREQSTTKLLAAIQIKCIYCRKTLHEYFRVKHVQKTKFIAKYFRCFIFLHRKSLRIFVIFNKKSERMYEVGMKMGMWLWVFFC